MNIPILHHNFDATGLELFYKDSFGLLVIIITFLIVYIMIFGMIRLHSKIFHKYDLYQKIDNKKKSLSAIILLSYAVIFSTLLALIPIIGFSIILDYPKFFSSNADSGKVLKPAISSDDFPVFTFADYFGLLRQYDENNTILSRYNDEFVKEMKNNEKMKEYTIPECELNDHKSIICGGNKLTTVKANKGNKTVTLTPHVEIEYDKAEIDIDNPNDKGVPVYYWIEETE